MYKLNAAEVKQATMSYSDYVTSQQEEDAWLGMPGRGARDRKCSQTGWSLCPDKLGQYQGPS